MMIPTYPTLPALPAPYNVGYLGGVGLEPLYVGVSYLLVGNPREDLLAEARGESCSPLWEWMKSLGPEQVSDLEGQILQWLESLWQDLAALEETDDRYAEENYPRWGYLADDRCRLHALIMVWHHATRGTGARAPWLEDLVDFDEAARQATMPIPRDERLMGKLARQIRGDGGDGWWHFKP